jgi:hypothetical protein
MEMGRARGVTDKEAYNVRTIDIISQQRQQPYSEAICFFSFPDNIFHFHSTSLFSFHPPDIKVGKTRLFQPTTACL